MRSKLKYVPIVLLFVFFLLYSTDALQELWRPCGIIGQLQNGRCVNSYNTGASIFFMPDGEMIVREAPGGQVMIQPIASTFFSLNNKTIALEHPYRIENTTLSPDGQMLATCVNRDVDDHFWYEDLRAEVWIWDIGSQKVLHQQEAPNDWCPATHLVFSPDNHWLVVTGEKKVELWDLSDLKSLTLPGCCAAAFSPEGGRLAIRSNHAVTVWDIEDQRIVNTFETSEHLVISLAFSPDGVLLAANTSDGIIYIWNVSAKELILTLEQESDSLGNIVFSSDGKLLASSSTQREVNGSIGYVYVWSVEDWVLKQRINLGKRFYPHQVDFSADNRMIAIGTSKDAFIIEISSAPN